MLPVNSATRPETAVVKILLFEFPKNTFIASPSNQLRGIGSAESSVIVVLVPGVESANSAFRIISVSLEKLSKSGCSHETIERAITKNIATIALYNVFIIQNLEFITNPDILTITWFRVLFVIIPFYYIRILTPAFCGLVCFL